MDVIMNDATYCFICKYQAQLIEDHLDMTLNVLSLF